jgi:phospholipid/cholesterol/gamma-HCH transport system substrate-binding protein
MKFSFASLPRWRTGAVLLFTALMVAVFVYLWVHSGGRLPGYGDSYQVSLQSQDLQNLVDNSDVMVAGVKVGSVQSIAPRGSAATAVVALDPSVVPLHQGATFALRSKTLVEETYVDITDGMGPALKPGAQLPLSANTSSVHLDQVLDDLTPQARSALGDLIRTGDTATAGRSQDVSSILYGLGVIGGPGHDALSALAAQSADLQKLSQNTAQVLAALDERQGEAAHLVDVANANMTATAAQHADLATTVRLLPQLLDTANAAAPHLQQLASDLRPLAVGLRTAAPGLNTVLAQLPATTSQLRQVFPTLSTVLDKAPQTLTAVQPFDAAVSALTPNARAALAQVNPIIRYLSPYGPDLASFFANDSSAFGLQDATSRYVRIFAVLNPTSLVGLPLSTTPTGLGVGENPYPAPGTVGQPQPHFAGAYPRVQPDAP